MRPIEKKEEKVTTVLRYDGKDINIKAVRTKLICSVCNHSLTKYWRYCPYCGNKIKLEEHV